MLTSFTGRRFLGTLAIVLAAASSCLAQTHDCGTTTTSWGASGSPPSWNGTSTDWGTQSTDISFQLLQIANPGCCGTITYPTCTQPVTPIVLTLSQTLTHTYTLNQSWDASTTNSATWEVLNVSAGFTFTSGETYTYTNAITSGLTRTINCGSEEFAYLETITTVTNENSQYSSLYPWITWANRSKNESTQLFYLSPLTPPNSSFTVCTGLITPGPKCPAVMIDVRCGKLGGN